MHQPLNEQDVRDLAQLAGIQFAEGELASMAGELNALVDSLAPLLELGADDAGEGAFAGVAPTPAPALGGDRS